MISAIGLYSSGHGLVAIEDVKDHVNHPHRMDYSGGIGTSECAVYCSDARIHNILYTFGYFANTDTIIGSGAPYVVFSLEFQNSFSHWLTRY